VEDGDVGAHGTAAVHQAGDVHADCLQGDILRPGQHLQKLDTAGSHTGEEDLRRVNLVAGTAVLFRAVHDEVVVAGSAEYAAERVDTPRAGNLDFPRVSGGNLNPPIPDFFRRIAMCKHRSLLFAGMLLLFSTIAAAQQPAAPPQEPPVYTYVASWGVPRQQWDA